MTIDLELGGYVIRIREPERRTRFSWPMRPYEVFQSDPGLLPDIDVTVHVVERLPRLPCESLLFDACHGLWKLFAAQSGTILEAADTQTLEPRSRAVISPDYARAEVWIREAQRQKRRGWVPMQVVNPTLEVCLLTKLGRERGFLLHAMGTLINEHGWVFTGASGAGKSTLSDLFAAQGGLVLSDERVFIRHADQGFRIIGTPWVGTSRHAKNHGGRLTNVFCIRHGKDRHVLGGMQPLNAMQFLLRQCFLPHWDREAMSETLSAISALAEQIDCFELAFLKDPDIVEYLRQQVTQELACAP